MASFRLLRVNELIERELGTILGEELERGPGDFATVKGVYTSPDLQHAKVYISIFPEARTKELRKELERQTFEIQQRLNERLDMRPVPKIEWVMKKEGAAS